MDKQVLYQYTADRYQRGLDLSDRESDRVADREGFRPTLG